MRDLITHCKDVTVLLATMSKAGRATYDSIYDQSTVIVAIEDGTESTYTPPSLIGAFA